MFKIINNLKENYSPLYFLAALGSGGLAVSFFMYIMFLTPHTGYPIPTFNTLYDMFSQGHLVINVISAVSIVGIIAFSILHVRLLYWNIREYKQFRQTEAYQKLCRSNAEVQLMAIPLTFAMSINVMFILGAVFVPNLWSIVEYLFPFAILAFAVTGFYAIRIFGDYSTRVLTNAEFDVDNNNDLSQMLGVFAFAMVGVGFSASAAMSHVVLTSGIATALSVLFLVIASIFAVIKMALGFQAMLKQGVKKEASVSLWIMIPIMTLIGIAVFRLGMGMHHNFGLENHAISNFVWFSLIVSVQLMFGYLGYQVMKRMGYFTSFVSGTEKSPASYALICPGVASVVMGFFFLNNGLVAAGILSKDSILYPLLLLPLIWLQFKTIKVLFTLNNKLLKA